MYGVASAPAIFQRLMEEILQGVPGVTVFINDIRVTGPNTNVHLLRLEEVLRRLQKYGLRRNKEKCDFFSDRIEYCGYMNILVSEVG
uniref:Reverse transcriptase domain-containing protein n=1 Tax=Anopheles epiroticus TaxID=199890 RepID=A0A182PBU2_9DIPT